MFMYISTYLYSFICKNILQMWAGRSWYLSDFAASRESFQRNGAFPLNSSHQTDPRAVALSWSQRAALGWWVLEVGAMELGLQAQEGIRDVHPLRAQSPSSHYCFGCPFLRITLAETDAKKATHSSTPKPSSWTNGFQNVNLFKQNLCLSLKLHESSSKLHQLWPWDWYPWLFLWSLTFTGNFGFGHKYELEV